MDDFRLSSVLNRFNINVPHYHAKWPFSCFSFERVKRAQEKVLKKPCVLRVQMEIDKFLEKAKKKTGDRALVNNGKNVTSHVRR